MNAPRSPSSRLAVGLGVLGLVAPAFALTTSSNNNFVLVQGLALLVFPVLGLVAAVGGLIARRAAVAVAGAGYALAALIQLVELGLDTNRLDGSASTFALLLALAVGLLITGMLPEDDTAARD